MSPQEQFQAREAPHRPFRAPRQARKPCGGGQCGLLQGCYRGAPSDDARKRANWEGGQLFGCYNFLSFVFGVVWLVDFGFVLFFPKLVSVLF